jgi:hypothetical protein
MKNIERVAGKPFWRMPVQGLQATGWAVQYVSGMEEEKIKPGSWLSQWNVSSDWMNVAFNFESELVMTFSGEWQAAQAAEILRGSEIKTTVVKIGADLFPALE